jgi:SAM-dependent methyltransferase
MPRPLSGPVSEGARLLWAESPSYLLRRWTVLRELRHAPPERVLEIGSGAGDLMSHLVRRGHSGTCVEISEEARRQASQRFARLGQRVTVLADLPGDGTFDLLLACEVLEHIEDDVEALRRWRSVLGDRGQLLLTVPAHPHRFGPSDVWAGHFRRYTRADLRAKARLAGFAVTRCICYGFPLGNLIEPLRHRVNARRLAREGQLTVAERTGRSGVQRDVERRLGFLSHPYLVLPFCWAQLPFFHTGWGTSPLALAEPVETFTR